MYALNVLYFIHHGLRIPLCGQDFHADGQTGNPVDRNTLVNGQNVAVILGNGLQDRREQPGFVIL